MDIINPFITSSPVSGEDFFGRAAVLKQVLQFLKNKDKTVLLVFGQRRMGKTSLLRKLQADAKVLRSAYPVYINLQASALSPLPRLLAEIARGIAVDLDLNLDFAEEIFNSLYFQKEFIPAVVKHLQGNKYLLPVFDEADVFESVQDTMENSPDPVRVPVPAYRHFIPFLETLVQEIGQQQYPVKLILAVGLDFRYSREHQFQSIAKLSSCSQIELPYFSKKETEALLNQLSAASIPFNPEAVNRIYTFTSGHPFFTQCLARVALEAVSLEKEHLVTPALVEQQFIPTIKRYSSSVSSVWHSFSPGDQVVLYLMAALLEDRQPVNNESLYERGFLLGAAAALGNLPHILNRLETAGMIKKDKKDGGEPAYDFAVEFIRKWIVIEVSEEKILEKQKQLTAGQTDKKGVLLLADVVNYTSQTTELGAGKTRSFDESFEAAIKTRAEKYKGTFIKRTGDSVLLFFQEETDALEFVLRLREASRERELDRGDFTCCLRMAAHFGKFNFTYTHGSPSDVTGPEAIVLFRVEQEMKKYKKHDILVTGFLLQLIEEELREKGIRAKLVEEKVLKGFQRKTPVYCLEFPTREDTAPGTSLLAEKMGELQRNTREIPVFGGIYPGMSMADNFINLDIAIDKETAAGIREKQWADRGFKNAETWMDTIEVRSSYHDERREPGMPGVPGTAGNLRLKVSELYHQFKRGIIFGLPGSGKTTILKYFAFRELKKNQETPDADRKRVVLFIQCRDIMSYREWSRQHPGAGSDAGAGLDYSIEFILGYLVHSFLFNRQESTFDAGVQRAENTVQRAYFQGRLTLLIDALDEAPDLELKDNLIAILKELFFHCKEGKRLGNRFYLTARTPEKERFPVSGSTALRPVFNVRSLDMEQLREMARYFYRGNPTLYKEFDTVVWQEEIAAKVGGTPLTALLVIAYFESFNKFDTRYHMYHVLMVFILVRAWKEIKEGTFDRDMKTFFREAKSPVVLEEKPYLAAGKVYDALTLLAYGYMGRQEKITGEDLVDNFSLFAREGGDGEAEKEAQHWLNRLLEDQLLVEAGPYEYVFIHATVMEYLAARFLVEKVKNPGYQADKFPLEDDNKKLLQGVQGETLPIAVGSGIWEGAVILRVLGTLVSGAKEQEQQDLLFYTAWKSVAEWESFIDRQDRRRRLDYLRLDSDKQISGNWDAVDWVYKRLGEILLSGDKNRLKAVGAGYENIAKFSRPYFGEKYLDFEKFSQGDSEILSLRQELLDRVLNREMLEVWTRGYQDYLDKREGGQAEEVLEKVGASVLTLDTRGYHPEDKNFGYYRAYTGKELMGILGSPNLKHSGTVYCVAFSRDGRYLVSSSSDGTLKLWDPGTGREIHTFKGHQGYVRSVALAADGTTMVSGSEDRTLKLWDVGTGREIRTFKGHEGLVTSVALASDGKTLISGSSDRTLKLWDVGTGQEIRSFKGHQGYVMSVALAADSTTMVSGSEDRTLKLWDVGTGREIRTFKGHEGLVVSVALAADSTTLVSGSDDRTLKLWDVGTGQEIRTFKGHEGLVMSVALAADGTTLVSGSNDGTLKLWDVGTGQEIRTFKGHQGKVWSVALAGDGTTLVSGSDDRTLKLWDVGTGQEIHTFKGHEGLVMSVALAGDGTTLVSGSGDHTLKLWDVGTGQEIHTFKGHEDWVRSVALVPDGTTLVSGSDDGTLKLWDVGTGQEIRTFKGHEDRVRSVALVPDGATLVSGSDDRTLKLWDVGTGQEIRTFKGHQGYVRSVALAADGTALVSGSDDGILKLWDVGTGQEIHTFKGHEGTVWSVALAADGITLVSGSGDRTLKLWDVGTGQDIRTFKGHEDWVRCVALAADGSTLVSGSYDYTLKCWDINTGVCLKTLPLLWIPLEIKAVPGRPGIFATANANSTVTLFDLSDIVNRS